MSDEREMTLLEASKAMSRALWDCRHEEVVLNKLDLAWQTLDTAIEREELLQPGQKVMTRGTDATPATVLDYQMVHLQSARTGGEFTIHKGWFRRPTPEELENWPGGEGND